MNPINPTGGEGRGKKCRSCAKPVHSSNKTGFCRPCRSAASQKAIRLCSQCGASLYRVNVTGLCKPCCIVVAGRKARENPEISARLKANAKDLARKNFFTPEARAKWQKSRKAVGERKTERVLGWCPLEYRREYKLLAKRGNGNAAQARAIILDRMRTDEQAKAKTELVMTARFHASTAAEFLRKFAPIKLTQEGWEYGYTRTILTSEELVERAQLRGWKPTEWQVAA
jgi:hypothetical protein